MLGDSSRSPQAEGIRRSGLPSRASFGCYAAVALVVGVALLYLSDLTTAIASPSWPTTHGVVISAEAETKEFYDHDVGLCPRVSYRYSVDDQDYVSHRLAVWTHCYNTQRNVDEFLKGYPTGKQVRVHYEAGNPANALLYPGIPDDFLLFFLFIIGGVLLLIAGLVFLLAVAFWERSFGHPFYVAAYALWRLWHKLTQESK